MQEWQLQVPNGYIQLVFTSIDIEADSSCRWDWVEVSYGSYSEKFCGSSTPGPFTSTGPTITVRMHTNGEVTRTGFSAVWTGTSSVGGTIMSQNHPSNYNNNYGDTWTLEPQEGHIIQLIFESFDIQAINPDCNPADND